MQHKFELFHLLPVSLFKLQQFCSLRKYNLHSMDAIRGSSHVRKCRRLSKMISTWSFGDRRRRELLVEFLHQVSAQNQKNAEGETSSQDLNAEVQNQVTLSDDLLFKILILLPADTLFRLQFVCKNWFSLIKSSVFIRCHAQLSEFVLICRRLTLPPPSLRSQGKPKSYFHIIDLEDGGNKFMESSIVGLGCIQASYNGLLLATNENSESLIFINPLTRKHVLLPSGTKGNFFVESFGIAFCDKLKTYNIVHLFSYRTGRTGCEILSVRAREWRRVSEPPLELLAYTGHSQVTVGGSLYWLFQHGPDFFLSLNLHDGKFISRDLPVACSPRDRLLDIDGNLGFVSNAEADVMHVWILITDGVAGENWVRKHSINVSVYSVFAHPICWRSGKGLVVLMVNAVYVYSFETGEMKLVRSRTGDDEVVWADRIENEYVPHRDTLASWEDDFEAL